MTESSSPGQIDAKTQVKKYFSRTAENYVASATHRTGSDLQRLLEVGEWGPEQQVLDVATGGGHTALAVAPHVQLVIATDLTPEMLKLARNFIQSRGAQNVLFTLADAEQLPFLEHTFDRVTCRIAPHHFTAVARFVREVARVLKPGGLFLLIDNTAPSDPELDSFDNRVEKWRDSSHGRNYTQEEWETLFSEAHLQVEYKELFRKRLPYHDWTTRSQLSASEKAGLERYILDSPVHIRRYFEVTVDANGHLDSLTRDSLLLKGRKS